MSTHYYINEYKMLKLDEIRCQNHPCKRMGKAQRYFSLISLHIPLPVSHEVFFLGGGVERESGEKSLSFTHCPTLTTFIFLSPLTSHEGNELEKMGGNH